jgi:hypothetical protein
MGTLMSVLGQKILLVCVGEESIMIGQISYKTSLWNSTTLLLLSTLPCRQRHDESQKNESIINRTLYYFIAPWQQVRMRWTITSLEGENCNDQLT